MSRPQTNALHSTLILGNLLERYIRKQGIDAGLKEVTAQRVLILKWVTISLIFLPGYFENWGREGGKKRKRKGFGEEF